MATEVEADIKQLRAELVQLRKDIGSLSTTIQQTAQDGSSLAVGKVKDQVDTLRGEAERLTGKVTSEIETHPLSGALAAFGVGVALGVMMTGRR